MPVRVLTNDAGATTQNVQGAVAHDSASIPQPMHIGAQARTSTPAAVSASGDLVNLIATMAGVQITKPYGIPEAEWGYGGSLTTTSDVPAKTAAGTGIKNHPTSLWAINTGASAVDLILKDGSTERHRYTLPVNVPVAVVFPTGVVVTANTALNLALSAAGTVRVNLHGYAAP